MYPNEAKGWDKGYTEGMQSGFRSTFEVISASSLPRHANNYKLQFEYLRTDILELWYMEFYANTSFNAGIVVATFVLYHSYAGIKETRHA